MHSRCQIHPLIAQIWRSRLPSKYVVIVSNDGYLPGRVNFSARSASGVNLLEFLRSQNVNARGHDQATGASLSVEQWTEFLAKLGFPG